MSERQPIKLMWDYHAFPLWDIGDYQEVEFDETRDLTPKLYEALQAWSDMRSDAMFPPGRPRGATPLLREDFPDEEWKAEGRRLQAEVQRQVGSRYLIGYYDEDTGEIDWTENLG